MHVEVGFGLRRGVTPVKSDYAIQMHFAIHFPVTFSVPAEVLCFWRIPPFHLGDKEPSRFIHQEPHASMGWAARWVRIIKIRGVMHNSHRI